MRVLRDNLQTLPSPGCIVKAMMRGLGLWTVEREAFHVQESMPEGCLKEALQEQTAIGWKNLIKGRIVKKWIDAAMDKPDGRIQFGSPKDGQLWGKKVISLLLAYGVDLWKHRNLGVHGESNVERNMIKRVRLVSKVKGLYRQKPKLRSTDDSRLFGVPLDTRLRSNNDYLEAWLCHVEVAQRSYAKFGEVKGQGKGKKQMTITEWIKGHTEENSLAPQGSQ